MSNLGVHAEAKTIFELLQPGTSFRIPTYQRSYSWQPSDAAVLVRDLVDAMDEGRTYFLGAIVCVRTSIPGVSEIVDGQQRLTTLSLTLACLRDLIDPQDQPRDLQQFLSDNVREGGWRLTLNHVDAPFFRKLAQRPGSTNQIEDMETGSTSQELMLDNLRQLRDEMLSLSREDRIALAQFILDKSVLVHVEVEDRDIGHKVFQVLNTRGRQPNAHDILKTELFERAALSSEEADKFARAWTQYEARLGTAKFDDLLRQIRALHDRQMRGNFVTGFCNSVLKDIPARAFLERHLPRFVEAYQELETGKVQLSRRMPEVDEHLARLAALDHTGWRAPALQFLVFHDRDPDTTREYFCDLERLGFAMQLVVTDRDARARRYRRLSEEVMSDAALFAPDGALTLTREERAKMSQRITGRFGSVNQRRALALKLNSLLPEGECLTTESDATVEHILPRNPDPESDWIKLWPNLAERRELCDSLGNFCLLAKKDNQKADRHSFSEKKAQFFAHPDKGMTFALTRDVLQYEEWGPDAVKDRTKRLTDLLTLDWKLDLPAG